MQALSMSESGMPTPITHGGGGGMWRSFSFAFKVLLWKHEPVVVLHVMHLTLECPLRGVVTSRAPLVLECVINPTDEIKK